MASEVASSLHRSGCDRFSFEAKVPTLAYDDFSLPRRDWFDLTGIFVPAFLQAKRSRTAFDKIAVDMSLRILRVPNMVLGSDRSIKQFSHTAWTANLIWQGLGFLLEPETLQGAFSAAKQKRAFFTDSCSEP